MNDMGWLIVVIGGTLCSSVLGMFIVMALVLHGTAWGRKRDGE
jgi:hypothetical protein